MSTLKEVTKERDELVALLSAFVAHVERSVRPNQHNPYTARELYPSLFAQADAALRRREDYEVRGVYARPVPAQAVPDGWRLVQVKSAEFDSLMYWLGRCADKGHLENCPDLIEPWANFDYRDVAAAPEHKA